MAARLTTYLVVGIVAVTLIAGLIVGAQRDDTDGPVDLIVHNAKVYTADGDGTVEEAVAVRGNQILRVGSNREINRLRRPQTVLIDAQGGTVLPGFNDAHVHLLAGALALQQIDLTGAESVADIQSRVRAWAEANPSAAWVTGRGWPRELFADVPPTRQMLDAAVADRPVHLVSADGESAWVNSRALALANITKRTKNPADGAVARDARSGEPTGVLNAGAMALVAKLLPATTDAQRADGLRRAIAEMHRNGITSIHDAGGPAGDLSALDELRRAGELQLRIYAAIALQNPVTDAMLDELEQLWAQYSDDPLLKAGAVEVTIDGELEDEAAATLEPYADDEEAVAPRVDPDTLNRSVRLLDSRGWQVMAHASGDRAVRMALNAFEHAERSNKAPERGRRHRVEHADLIDPADVRRFSGLDAMASMQPGRGVPTAENVDRWTKLLGTERLNRTWPYATLASRKAQVALGSDWPAAPLSPLRGIHAAVTRTASRGNTEVAFNPDERMRLEDALDGYTLAGARASFDEQRKGSLAPGMLADLVVLTDDILEGPPSRLLTTSVAVTIFDGKVVYRRGGRAASVP
jgi:hypothetical protein